MKAFLIFNGREGGQPCTKILSPLYWIFLLITSLVLSQEYNSITEGSSYIKKNTISNLTVTQEQPQNIFLIKNNQKLKLENFKEAAKVKSKSTNIKNKKNYLLFNSSTPRYSILPFEKDTKVYKVRNIITKKNIFSNNDSSSSSFESIENSKQLKARDKDNLMLKAEVSFKLAGKNDTRRNNNIIMQDGEKDEIIININNNNNQNEMKKGKILFKIWNLANGKLELVNEREIPEWMTEGYNLTDNEILNFNEIPLRERFLVEAGLRQISHKKTNKERRVISTPSSTFNDEDYNWIKLPIIHPNLTSPDDESLYKSPINLNYVMWKNSQPWETGGSDSQKRQLMKYLEYMKASENWSKLESHLKQISHSFPHSRVSDENVWANKLLEDKEFASIMLMNNLLLNKRDRNTHFTPSPAFSFLLDNLQDEKHSGNRNNYHHQLSPSNNEQIWSFILEQILQNKFSKPTATTTSNKVENQIESSINNIYKIYTTPNTLTESIINRNKDLQIQIVEDPATHAIKGITDTLKLAIKASKKSNSKKIKGKKKKERRNWLSSLLPNYNHKHKFDFEFGFDFYELMKKKLLAILALKLIPLFLFVVFSLLPVYYMYWKDDQHKYQLDSSSLEQFYTEHHHHHPSGVNDNYYNTNPKGGGGGWAYKSGEVGNRGPYEIHHHFYDNNPSSKTQSTPPINTHHHPHPASGENFAYGWPEEAPPPPEEYYLDGPIYENEPFFPSSSNFKRQDTVRPSLTTPTSNSRKRKKVYKVANNNPNKRVFTTNNPIETNASALHNHGFLIGKAIGNLMNRKNQEALRIILEDKKDAVLKLMERWNLLKKSNPTFFPAIINGNNNNNNSSAIDLPKNTKK